MKLKFIWSIIFSLDFLPSLLAGILLLALLPEELGLTTVSHIYEAAINVLAIVFSVYFAALAFIMSAGDDDFISFLEKRNRYKDLINYFRYSLIVLFVSMIVSIGLFAGSSIQEDIGATEQNKAYLSFFGFLFLYALNVSLSATLNSIKYALSRVAFIRKKEELLRRRLNSTQIDIDDNLKN